MIVSKLLDKLADDLVALINSKVRSPTREEIVEVLRAPPDAAALFKFNELFQQDRPAPPQHTHPWYAHDITVDDSPKLWAKGDVAKKPGGLTDDEFALIFADKLGKPRPEPRRAHCLRSGTANSDVNVLSPVPGCTCDDCWPPPKPCGHTLTAAARPCPKNGGNHRWARGDLSVLGHIALDLWACSECGALTTALEMIQNSP